VQNGEVEAENRGIDPGGGILAKRLEWFRDLKFGFMVHWGPYSQKGCIESWPLSEEDTWARPGWQGDINRFREEYWALNTTFNPVDFDPDKWADLANRAGMKYLVFTTKHHDGFNMYDTKLSDYKITARDCPFHTHPQADVARAVFDAFRSRGFGIGVYYSKADWHSPYYWVPGRPAKNRNPNYDTGKHPDTWNRFVEFTHGQIKELMSGYGPVDILWLDAGWVRPPAQDIRMDELVRMARGLQPGLIVVDRTVGGRYENYRTPEQQVPEEPLDEPWETCMTMGDQWSYNQDDRYKSTRQLIHLLVDVVAKGGNLLLNVGPAPTGELPQQAEERLLAIGKWMEKNGEAIYGTRVCPPYRQGNYALTHRGDTKYVIYMLEEGKALPQKIRLRSVRIPADARIELIGLPGTLNWRRDDGDIVIEIPENTASEPPSEYACTFKIT